MPQRHVPHPEALVVTVALEPLGVGDPRRLQLERHPRVVGEADLHIGAAPPVNRRAHSLKWWLTGGRHGGQYSAPTRTAPWTSSGLMLVVPAGELTLFH